MSLFNKSKKKQMEFNKQIAEHTEPFKFYGSGRHLKSVDEHQALNKEEADQSFKKYKREVLDTFLKENGFYKYKSSSYVRLNKNRLVEDINIQKDAYGSRTFTLNISLYPLYAPCDFMCKNFGNRIGTMIDNRDFWWDYKDDKTAKLSFENVKNALEQFVIPWFDIYDDETKYKEDLLNRKYQIGYDCIIWTTFLFLKQDEKEKAIEYLDKIKKDDYVLDHHKKGFNPYALKKINQMREILETNTDIRNYLIEIEKMNVEKFKLPKGFLK